MGMTMSSRLNVRASCAEKAAAETEMPRKGVGVVVCMDSEIDEVVATGA